MSRKIVQIAVIPETEETWATVIAVADDGTTWSVAATRERGVEWVWRKLPDLPQETDEERPLYCFGGRIIGGDEKTDEEKPA